MCANLKFKLQWTMGSITVSRRFREYLNFWVKNSSVSHNKKKKKCFNWFKITIILLFWFGNFRFEETFQSLLEFEDKSIPCHRLTCTVNARLGEYLLSFMRQQITGPLEPGELFSFILSMWLPILEASLEVMNVVCLRNILSSSLSQLLVIGLLLKDRQTVGVSLAWCWYSSPFFG